MRISSLEMLYFNFSQGGGFILKLGGSSPSVSAKLKGIAI